MLFLIIFLTLKVSLYSRFSPSNKKCIGYSKLKKIQKLIVYLITVVLYICTAILEDPE